MSQELRIKIFNDNGEISYSYEAAAEAVRKIAEYIEPEDVTDCHVLYISEFAQIVFMLTIKTSANHKYTPGTISNYKAELKKQISKSLNLPNCNICITYTN
mgnify:CR=1 FL=1